jgi:hypothetical protein
VLIETASEERETERHALQSRISALASHAQRARQEIEEMSKPVAVAAK